MKIELKFGVVIESEIDDKYDYHDIGELIAADIYNMLENGEKKEKGGVNILTVTQRDML